MNRKQRVNKILLNNFNDFSIEIKDNSHLHVGHHNFNGNDETHLEILLTRNDSTNINRLQIHRKINDLIKNEFDTGLHAIEIKINQF